jgi:hypothetical protein
MRLIILTFALTSLLIAGNIDIATPETRTISPPDTVEAAPRMFMKFDIPDSVYSRAFIEHAEIILGVRRPSATIDSDIMDNPLDISIFAMGVDRSPAMISWESMNWMVDTDREIRPEYTPDADGVVKWDITDYVRTWVVEDNNFGLIIFPQSIADEFELDMVHPPVLRIHFLPNYGE